MKHIFSKCLEFTDADVLKSHGCYPYFRSISSTKGSSVVADGKPCVMVSSNNYLGLTHDARVKKAAQDAIAEFGAGCTGSRFLSGNLTLHEIFEARLARFLDKEDCLLYSTGFMSNQGAIPALLGRQDVLYCDRESHASIFEGIRCSVGDTVKFRHNDMTDLERVLKMTRHKFQGAMIIADGIFSMSGDICRLEEVNRLAKAYDCVVYIDDAHAVGVLGPKGQGTPHHFGLENDVEIVSGTLSKTFASIGGFVAGSKEVINYLRHKSRSFVFSASAPASNIATAIAVLDIMETEPHHIANLWRNTNKMSKALTDLGFNTLNSQTPIIPLFIGKDMDAFLFAQQLFEYGVFATPVVMPAVPPECALVRTAYMSTHTDEELDYALEIFEKLGRTFGLIGPNSRQHELHAIAQGHFGT